MGLIMATPAKRKRSSKYQFRRGTPADLLRAKDKLAALGVRVPREAVESLKTRDPAEAKRLHSEASLKWEARWDSWRKLLRDGPRVLSQKEMFAVVAEMGRDVRKIADENPGDPQRWQEMAQDLREHSFSETARETFKEGLRTHLGKRYGWAAVAEESLEAVLWQFVNDLPRIAGDLETLAGGDYGEPKWLAGRPRGGEALRLGGGASASLAGQSPGHAVTFSQLLESWQRGRGPSPSSIRAYKSRLKDFTKMLGHEIASRVTRDDVHRWLEQMLEQRKVGDETVRDRLAALSSLFEWGVEKRLLAENVAAHVKLRKRLDAAKDKPTRDFTEEEAQRILGEARRKAGFLRWAPWIMAHTAMRVGEVAQLRRKDVIEDGQGGWMLVVDPAAGHVKGHRRREIPAHSALVKEGFIGFVETCKTDRLFPEFYRNAGRAKDPHNVSSAASALMSRWVRGNAGLGITDLTIRPSHSWRHLFNTLSREHELERDVRKAMVGHMDDATAESYGGATAKAKRKQIEKLPSPKRD